MSEFWGIIYFNANEFCEFKIFMRLIMWLRDFLQITYFSNSKFELQKTVKIRKQKSSKLIQFFTNSPLVVANQFRSFFSAATTPKTKQSKTKNKKWNASSTWWRKDTEFSIFCVSHFFRVFSLPATCKQQQQCRVSASSQVESCKTDSKTLNYYYFQMTKHDETSRLLHSQQTRRRKSLSWHIVLKKYSLCKFHPLVAVKTIQFHWHKSAPWKSLR